MCGDILFRGDLVAAEEAFARAIERSPLRAERKVGQLLKETERKRDAKRIDQHDNSRERRENASQSGGTSISSRRRCSAAWASCARARATASDRTQGRPPVRVLRPAFDVPGFAGRLADGELLARAAHDFEPWRPGDEGVALRLDPPCVGDNPVDFTGEHDQPPPELARSLSLSAAPRGGAGAGAGRAANRSVRFGTRQPRTRLGFDPTTLRSSDDRAIFLSNPEAMALADPEQRNLPVHDLPISNIWLGGLGPFRRVPRRGSC